MSDDTTMTSGSTPLVKHGWLRALLFLISALVASAIFTFMGMVVLATIIGYDFSAMATNSRDFIKDIGLPANIVVSFFGFIGMLGVAWLFRRFVDKKSFRSLGFDLSNYKKDLIIGLLGGFGLIASGFVILMLMGHLSISETNFNLPLILGYILLFAIASFNEEIMVRGYIMNNLFDSMDKYVALIISSLLFAVMHLANANITILSVTNIFLAGILLGIYYVHKQNLWLPIALHFSWNYFQGPIFGFEVSGVDVNGLIIQDVHGPDLLTGGQFGFEGSILATFLMVIAIIFLHYKFQGINRIGSNL
jgi:membrane protease YdiL (CAAX protease family)